MTGERSIKDQSNKGGDDSSKVSSDILMSMLAARMGDKTPEAAKPATPKAETAKAETPKAESKPDAHTPSSSALSLRASSFTLASSDHLTAKPKVEKEEPSKPATAGNVSSAAVGGFGRSIYENVNGFFSLGASKATSESDLLYQAATGTSRPGAGNSSVRGFFETGKTIATNIDKVPGALAGQAGDLYKTVKSGDAVKIADAGGHLAGTIATIFLPVGATSKVGTTARETAILANGAKEVKAASTLVSDYARLNGITEAAAASKVTRMPIPSVTEMRAATARLTETVADDVARLATPAAKPHVPIVEKPNVAAAAAERPPVAAAADKPHVAAAATERPPVAAADKPHVAAAAAERPPVAAAADNTNVAGSKVLQPEARAAKPEGTVTAEGAIAQPEAGRVAQAHLTQPDGRVIQPESRVAQTEVRVAQPEVRVAQTEVRVAQPEVRVAQPEGRLVQDARPTQDLRPGQAQEARVIEPGTFESRPTQDLRPVSERKPAQDLRPVSEARPISEARPVSDAVPEVAAVKAPGQSAGVTRNEIIANTARNEQVIEGAVQSAQKVEATTKLTESTAKLSNRVEVATRQVEVGSVVERELKEISRDLETVARGASPDKVMQTVQQRITAIENHGAKEIAQDLRRGVDDVQKSSTQARGHGVDRVESSTPVPVAQAALTEDVAQVGAKSRQLSTTVEREMSTLVGADRQIAQDLAKDVKAIERAVESKNISGVQTMVDDLAKKPEFARLIQENPRLAEGLNDLRTSTAAMTRSENVLEGAVQTAQRTEASVQLTQGSSKLAGQAEAAIVRAESPVVQKELQEVAKDMRTIAQGADPQAVASSVRKRLEVIESQGPSAAPIARDLRSGLDDVEKLTGNARAVGVSRVEPVVVPQQLTAKLGEDVARVGRNTQPLSSAIEVEAMALKGADREIAEKIANDLRGIERASQPQAIKTPVESSREIQRLVDDLAKPEYSRFFAERPHLAQPLRDLRASANTMGRNQSLVENSMRSVERLETGVKLGQETTTFSTRVETLAQSQPAAIQRELKEIANDVRTISQSANPDKVIAGVRNRLEVIQEQGGAAIARDLRAGVDDIEKLSLSANRATRVETAAVTIEREGAVVADRASVLSRELKPVAEVAPSKGAALPVETQVSKHLDNIAEQARVVATSPDQVRAITSMRNSINQIEELGGARILRPEQAKAYQELTQSITRMDKAAVEIRGVQSVENVGRSIARPLDAMPNVAQDLTKAVRTAGKEEALAANLRRVEEASLELKGARTLDEQVAASKKLGQELENPQLKALTQENVAVRNAHTRLADEVSRVDELAHLSRRERQVARVEGQVDDLTEKVSRVERPVAINNANPVQQVAQPSLRNAAQEYQVAINDIRRGATDANALSRADRALVRLENEATTSGVAVQTMQDIRQGHKALVTSTRELEESTHIVVSKGVERIEKGFSDVEKATSTVAQRQIIRETSDRIQDLRYVDTNPVGASQLEQAQTRLMRAHNDIEVATYRSNLVKLAAAGDQTALDKLLISGLNKDGNRLAAFGADVPGYLSTRAFLMGQGRDGAFVRNLSAADPFFTNNRGLLINPMTVGAAKVGLLGTIGYLEANDLANRIDRQLLIEEYEKNLRERGILGDAAAATSAAAASAAAAAAATENLRVLPKQGMLGGELKSSQLPPPSEIIRSNPIISPQTLMRSASSFSNQNRVIANQNRVAAGQNYGIQPLSAAAPLAKPERVAFGIFEDDPDKYMKMSLMTTFGTPFIPLRQGSTIKPDEVVVAPVVRAGSVPVKFTYHGDGRIESRLDKPATSQYVLPSAMSLTNPLSLTRDNQARKDGAMRSSIFASQSSITGGVTSGKPVAKSDLSALSSYVNAETEGSGGHDARKLNDIEESETGVDKSGSGAVVVNSAAANNAMDDDEDDENNGAQPTVNTRVPKVPQPVMADVSGAASPVMESRAKIGVPPRKRTQAS